MKLVKAKRLLCLLLALVLAMALSGCGDLSQAMDVAQDVYDVYNAVESADEILSQEEEAAQGFDQQPLEVQSEGEASPFDLEIDRSGSYTSKDDVALYIFTYGCLPENFVTKNQARQKGWEGGSLEPYFPGCCIGGDSFGNREGLLPEADGRSYKECDIDTLGSDSRGAKRIVFSNDGLIYYTDDHYQSFTLLYGEE